MLKTTVSPLRTDFQ